MKVRVDEQADALGVIFERGDGEGRGSVGLGGGARVGAGAHEQAGDGGAEKLKYRPTARHSTAPTLQTGSSQLDRRMKLCGLAYLKSQFIGSIDQGKRGAPIGA